MRVFLAMIAKQDVVPPDLVELTPALAASTLPFRDTPYREEVSAAANGRLVLFAWDNDVEERERRPLIHLRGRSSYMMAGLVSHPKVRDGWDVKCVVDALPVDEMSIKDLGGSFALLRADAGRATVDVWNTVTRITPVYWAETDELVIVGTRAVLISCLLTGAVRPDYDLHALVPFLVRGFCPNEQTLYRDVHVLPPNAQLIASRAGVGLVPIDGFDRECGRLLPTARDYDDLASLLVSSVSGLAGKPVVCDLTGGKDSRLVAAALHRAGVTFVARTGGFATSPDVIIGRKVADLLGMDHELDAPPMTKRGGARVIEVDLAARTRRTLLGADGMLTAYENVGGNRPFSRTPVRIGGVGGESLRGGFAKLLSMRGPVTWETARDFLLGRYVYPADLFDPDALASHQQFLEDWIAAERGEQTRSAVALDKFYLHFRTGRWAAATRSCQYGSYSVSPLLDNQVTKAGLRAHESVKLSELLNYNLMLRLAPHLVDVPFAEFRWGFEADGPRPGEEGPWLARTPLTAPRGTLGAFNWRFAWTTDLYDLFHERLLGDRRTDTLFDVVDRRALRRRLTKARGTVPTVRTTLLFWALYTGSVLVSNEWLASEIRPHRATIRVPAGQADSPAPESPGGQPREVSGSVDDFVQDDRSEWVL